MVKLRFGKLVWLLVWLSFHNKKKKTHNLVHVTKSVKGDGLTAFADPGGS